MNTSFVLVKPSACRDTFIAKARDHFDSHGIRVDDMQLLTGQEVSRGAYVERHYSATAARVMSSSLEMGTFASEESAMLFFSAFGESWTVAMEERRVLTPEDAMVALNTTMEGLNARWWSSKLRVRLEYGFYVSYFKEEGLYVINGFYPLLFNSFTAPTSKICFFVLSWPEARYSWKRFCLEVIGAADPSEADSTSLRRLMYENWEEYGLSEQPSIADNGLIYANGPIEALALRSVWMHRGINEDDFGRQLLQEGVGRGFVEGLMKNPPISYKGACRSVFEITEDMQSSEATCLVAAVYADERQKCLSERNNQADTPISPSRIADWTIVLNDEDPDEVRNRALLFVKPHANTPETRALVEERLTQVKGIQILSQHHISGSEIASRHVMEQHYGTIAKYAAVLTPDLIELSPKTMQEFQERFGMSWKELVRSGRVWNADSALRILGDISSTELYEMWCSCTDVLKVAPGAYVARLSEENAFVINGFFPYIRDSYERKDAKVTCYVVSWLEEHLTWRSFREELVGCTNPAKAPSTSLRGLIQNRWRELGLQGIPTTTNNGVHASAGPLEAVLERYLWIGSPLTHDPLTLRLQERGLTGALLYGWRSNPAVVMADGVRSGHVFDLLENLQTSEVVDLMCEAEQHVLAEYNERSVNRAVVVLRPFAVNEWTIETVRNCFAAADVAVMRELTLLSRSVEKRYLGSNEFLKLAHWADFKKDDMCGNVSSSIKKQFHAQFGYTWEGCVISGQLMGATSACEVLGLTPTELLHLWESVQPVQLHSNCWVVHLTDHEIYVLNGFVPFVRETHGKPGSVTHVFDVEWKEDVWTWHDLSERLVGFSDDCIPYKATEGSLQRTFADEWKGFGLPFKPASRWSAAVSVSQGPLEGTVDREIWLDVQLPEDHFVQRLLLEGVPLSMLTTYIDGERNPQDEDDEEEEEGVKAIKNIDDTSSPPPKPWTSRKNWSATGCFLPQYTRSDLSYHVQSSEVVRRMKVITSRFLRGLKMNYAFLWVKPHACTKHVEAWIPKALLQHRIEVISSGRVPMAEVFDKELADRKQCTLYRNAMTRAVHEIPISTKQMAEFDATFGITWNTAMNLHLVINAAQAVDRIGVLQLLKDWDEAPRKVCLAPSLYIAYLEREGLYVVNGFYPYLRSRMYAGSHVSWYVVSWDSEIMTWGDFHRYVIGTDVPEKAEESSLRHTLYKSWVELGLQRQPDGIDNGFCASATPVEGLADRVSWLGVSLEQDVFGRLLVMGGVDPGYLRKILENPLVRHREEPLESMGDAFDKLCTENPLLIAQLIGLQSSGGMHIVSPQAPRFVPVPPELSSSHEYKVKRDTGKECVDGCKGVLRAEGKPLCFEGDTSSTLKDEEGNLKRNYAFIVVNPACTSSEASDRVINYIADFLRHYNIRIDGSGSMVGGNQDLSSVAHAVQDGVFKYAVRQSPYQYALDSEALSLFLSTFGTMWDPRKVFNAVDAAVEFDYSAAYLRDRWLMCEPLARIAPNCFVGKMPDHDVYVVNGFALHTVETFCGEANMKYFLTVSWNSSDMDYAHFMDYIIGDPYLKEARPGSLQQVLCEEWKAAGLRRPPDSFEGAVMASASPLEAMRLKQMWLSLGIKRDAVCRFGMDELSITPYVMRRCLTNPRTPCGDGRFLFDMARRMNSKEALQLLQSENFAHLSEAPRNSAFVLMKTGSLCRGFALTVETVFARARVRIDEEGDVSAATLRERDFVQHLYAVELKYADCDVSTIKLSRKERDRVQLSFGVSWCNLLEGGVLVNAYEALVALSNITPVQLFYKCTAASRRLMVRPGLEIFELPFDGVFVVNGLMPGLKCFLESSEAMHHWYVVSWEPREMDWPTFLEEVVGSESPADAVPTSIRGQLNRRWRDYGITEPPDELRNGLHVSQGAIQAIRERTKCVKYSVQEDYLGSLLLRKGVLECVLQTWVENPEVLSGGIKMSIFEHLGQCDTSRVMFMMTALSEELKREEEEEVDPTGAARLPANECAHDGGRDGTASTPTQERHSTLGEETEGPMTVSSRASQPAETGPSLLYRNTAMIILKPHAAGNVKVMGLLERVLNENGIRIKREVRKRTTPTLIEKQFSSPMLYATTCTNGYLDVTPGGEDDFYDAFGEEWKEAAKSQRVVGAREALIRFSLTPSQLYVKWSLPQQQHVHLAYDMEITKFHAEDVYVVNAAIPFECERMIESEPGVNDVHCYIVSWDQRDCSWKKFLHDVIGDPDPERAVPTSFRGELFSDWEDYDLPVRPNRIDNVVLASEGPLQAYKERDLWCGTGDFAPDPLVRALCHVDHDPTDLSEWAENPLVRYTGSKRHELNDGYYTGHMFSFVHGLDTKQFIDVLTEREGTFVPLAPAHIGLDEKVSGNGPDVECERPKSREDDWVCDPQHYFGNPARNSDEAALKGWLWESLLHASAEDVPRLWVHYGGKLECKEELRKQGYVSSLLSRVAASSAGNRSSICDILRSTIDGEAFERDIKMLDFFGQPPSKGKMSKMFEGMRRRGNGRMTYEEFRVALAMIHQM